MRSLNLNIDPSAAPSWLMVLLLASTLAAEILHTPAKPEATLPGATIAECRELCGDGRVASYTPYACTCATGEG